MRAHADDGLAARFGAPTFRLRSTSEMVTGRAIPDAFPTCSYCGSVDVPTVIRAFQTPGTRYSGADWKYGWPHKLYVDIACDPYETVIGATYEQGRVVAGSVARAWRTVRYHKFYHEHLDDASDAELAEFNRVVAVHTGIAFGRRNGTLRYRAVRGGWQTWGVIGVANDPEHPGPVVPADFVARCLANDLHPEDRT